MSSDPWAEETKKLEDLPELVRQAFEAAEFELGAIPLVPPPVSVR